MAWAKESKRHSDVQKKPSRFAGIKPETKVCPDCKGKGEYLTLIGNQRCPKCDGHGKLEILKMNANFGKDHPSMVRDFGFPSYLIEKNKITLADLKKQYAMDKNEELASILEYIEDDDSGSSVESCIADYFDFDNRTLKVSKSELDWIKNNLNKKTQIRIFGRDF